MEFIKTCDFSKLSQSLTKNISKKEKKDYGIFFTPPNTIHRNLDILEPFMDNITNVMEPSCGSCEYILSLNQKFNNLNITGIEYNKIIYNSIQHLSKNNIELYNQDYLLFDKSITYDLIIGNPPYFVMKKDDVSPEYYEYFDGRPNIFILFIIKSLKSLNINGILSFVLPKSFLNCLYYDKTRKFISNHFKIIDIIDCFDDYMETKQATIIILIQNNNTNLNNDKFILNINNFTIFSTEIKIQKLKILYTNSTNLSNLKFTVNVGNVVWNQCKSILTDNKKKTLLIYSSDICNNELIIKKYDNKDKKNYIDKKGCNSPILVINRGYGVGCYKFDYCLIKGGFEYLIENHLICIKYTEPINNDDLILLYNKIINSLENNKTKQFIDLYFGNNAINTTELNYILPIYDI